jgi:tetratricopeptide (TPR) repeat protein
MPRIHPKAEVFDGLLQVFPEERDRLRRHRSRGPRSRLKPGSGSGRVLSWRASGDEYDQVVDGVLDRFRPRIEAAVREMAQAPLLLGEILGKPSERREELVRGERFRSLALCRLLLDRSHEETIEAPVEGERLAALALTITEALDPARYCDRVLEDARARAWIAIANARRVAGDLWGSEHAIQTAEEHLRHGMRDCLEKALLLEHKACLRRAQRRFPEAARLFRRSISISLCTEQSRSAAQAIVGLALVEHYRGEPERSIQLLERAAGLIDPDEDARLYGCIQFNRINSLVETGKILEAQAILARNPGLGQLLDEVSRLRIRWLEARIALALGRYTEALALLDEVRNGFVLRENSYDAAQASLELAAVHAGLGHVAAAQRLAREAQPIFQSLGIVREALAASILCRQAAAADQRRAKA